MKKSLFLCLLFLCVWGTAWADISKTWTDGASFSPWRPYGSLPSGMACAVSRAYSLYEVEYVVSVASAGNVVVGLQYSGGSHGLRTLGVDLIGSDGAVSYKSYNEVNVGSRYQSTPYNYTLSSVAEGTYILRIIVCHESKDNNLANTRGNITVTGADEVTTASGIYTAYNNIASSTTYVSDTNVGAYTTAIQTALANAASAYNAAQTDANLTALQDAHRTRQGGPNNRTVLANGEIFQIKCTNRDVNRGYLAYYNNTNVEDKVVLAGASYGSNPFPAITADGVYIGWAVYYYNDKYYLYNTQKKQFLKATSEQCTFTETAADASPIILGNTDGSLTEWRLKVAGTNNDYICAAPGYANNDGAVRIVTNAGDAGVKFNLIKVTDGNGDILTVETATQNLIVFDKILHPFLASKTPTLGTGIGEYTYSGSNQATDEANIATAKSYVDGTVTPTEAEILAAITNMTNVYSSLTINQPTAGKLYRFKGKTSQRYMKSNGAGSQMTVSANLDPDNGPATIFMLTDGNKLLSYDLGLYANDTHSIGSTVNNYNTYSFLKSEGGNVGYYTIKSNYSGSKYLWSNTSNTDRNGEYAEGNCDWEIEEVPYLPVPIYNDDYKLGTFYSPVPLIPNTERIKFYTGTVTNNYFNLTEYTGDVIPANKAFVTEYVEGGQTSNNCAYLQITSDRTPTTKQQEQLDNNQLQGQFETITTPTITGKTICTMQEISSALTFASYTGTTVKGFRAYLPVDNSTTGGGDSSFRLVFGMPTGIDTIGNQPAQEQTVYDLSGRRVEHAGKGLYIVNGKKVMIK